MRFLKIAAILIVVVYVLPAALSALLWKMGEHPGSWSSADWTSSRLLPSAGADERAAVYVMAARTGGLKGALADHSWIVVKEKGASAYERWDKVGWGSPIRHNRYPADGRWYSNEPRIVFERHGAAAEAIIPEIRTAIDAYPYAENGGYRIFPGPNSNSFTAFVMRQVPGIDATLPPVAVGRDYPVDGRLFEIDPDGHEARFSLFGYAGIVMGAKSGVEVNFLGLVAGIDPWRLLVKVPAFGSFALRDE